MCSMYRISYIEPSPTPRHLIRLSTTSSPAHRCCCRDRRGGGLRGGEEDQGPPRHLLPPWGHPATVQQAPHMLQAAPDPSHVLAIALHSLKTTPNSITVSLAMALHLVGSSSFNLLFLHWPLLLFMLPPPPVPAPSLQRCRRLWGRRCSIC